MQGHEVYLVTYPTMKEYNNIQWTEKMTNNRRTKEKLAKEYKNKWMQLTEQSKTNTTNNMNRVEREQHSSKI